MLLLLVPAAASADIPLGTVLDLDHVDDYASIPDNIARENKRAIWALSQLQVLDGGLDGDLVAAASPPTTGICPPACIGNDDEAVFLRQGLFLP